jgi:hypothetical protein
MAPAGPSNLFVNIRDGQVLGPRMLLKADFFPAKKRHHLHLHVSGAPHFRQTGRLPIFGVGQPTVYGIRTIFNMIKPMSGTEATAAPLRVVWINLREEPVVYINNRPFGAHPRAANAPLHVIGCAAFLLVHCPARSVPVNLRPPSSRAVEMSARC